MLCLINSSISAARAADGCLDQCTWSPLCWTATRSVQRWPAHSESVLRHWPPAGRDVHCLTTMLLATLTAVNSAVPGTAEPGLQLCRRQLSGHLLSAPHATISCITPDILLAVQKRLERPALEAARPPMWLHRQLGLWLHSLLNCGAGNALCRQCNCSCMCGVKWLLRNAISACCAVAHGMLHNSSRHSEITVPPVAVLPRH